MNELQKINDGLMKQVSEGNSKLDEYVVKYNTLLAEMEELKEKTNNDHDKTIVASDAGNDEESIQSSLQKLITSTKSAAEGMQLMRSTWTTLEASVKQVKKEIAGLKQYSRINSLLFHGIKIPKGLQGYDFALYMCDIINELLGNHLRFRLELWHIEFGHVLPTKSQKKSVVIIKFKSRFMKYDIYDNRAKLKGTGVSVTEHLIPENLDLLSKTREVIGFTNVWTSQTKILANLEGEIIHVKDSRDIEELKKKCLDAFPEGLPRDYSAPRKDKKNSRAKRPYYTKGQRPYGSSNTPHSSHVYQPWQNQYTADVSSRDENVLNFSDTSQYPNPPHEKQSKRHPNPQS